MILTAKQVSGSQLAEISKLAEAGKVKAVVDSVYPLDEYKAAFNRLTGGGTRGKVVLRIDDED
jgi:NADPH:quinone reductase-like Zn-dependent oxidoreductase